MGRRLIVDTNVLIALERAPGQLPHGLQGDDELAIASITRAELLVGIHLASSPALRQSRARTIRRILALVETLDYTGTTAEHHAELLAHTRTTGAPRGAHDLIIAAHARESSRVVLTRDARARFDDLPGVWVV